MSKIYDAFLSFSFMLIAVFFALILIYTRYVGHSPDNFTWNLAITSSIIVIGIDLLFITMVLIAKQQVPFRKSILSISTALIFMLLYYFIYLRNSN